MTIRSWHARAFIFTQLVVGEVVGHGLVRPSLTQQIVEVALISLLLKLITSTIGRCCSLNGF